ncbi:large ribosomal subunit protein mL53 [Ambystoma mexicanum]|uniref:large ribosomal subunit protein mL53 n=1 Tax=Ambystoma mexicanum TaxID=8296 RepID=UPI0037E82106
MAASKAVVVLKSVKKIAIQFCPFEANVRSTREFLKTISSKDVRSTNAKCETVTEVKHDKSEPLVNVTFEDGERLVMKGALLSSKEMIAALNARCTAKELQAKENARK